MCIYSPSTNYISRKHVCYFRIQREMKRLKALSFLSKKNLHFIGKRSICRLGYKILLYFHIAVQSRAAYGEFLEAWIRDPPILPPRRASREISRVHGPSSISVSQCVLRSAAIKISVWLHRFLSYSPFLFAYLTERDRILHGSSSCFETRRANRCIFFLNKWMKFTRSRLWGRESLLEMRSISLFSEKNRFLNRYGDLLLYRYIVGNMQTSEKDEIKWILETMSEISIER